MRQPRINSSSALTPTITMTTLLPHSPLVAHRRSGPRRNLLGLVLWVAMLVAATPRAEAADKLVAVFEPKVEGVLTAEERSRLDAAVAEALRELQYQIVPAAERDTIISGEGVQNCFTEECQERIGRLLGSQAVLVYKVKVSRPEGSLPPPEPAGPKKKGRAGVKEPPKELEPEPAGAGTITWGLTASLFNVEVGSSGATAKADCSKCSATLAAQSLGELVKKIVLEDAARPRGTIEILSDPPNASVFIDGHEIGVTPYKRVAFAGKHDVTVRKTGHRSKQETVNVIEAQKTSVTLRLTVGQDDRVILVYERQPRPRWRVGLGIAGLVVGAVTLGFGGRALYLDGRCIDAPSGGQTRCDTVFNTQGLGVGLVAGGAAVSILGMVALAIPGKAVQVQKPLPSGPSTNDAGPLEQRPAPVKKAELKRLSFGALGSGVGMRAEGSF